MYAVGDIAKFPLRLPCIEQAADADYSTAIGHWQIALSHGKTAGLNVAAKQVTSNIKLTYHIVPEGNLGT